MAGIKAEIIPAYTEYFPARPSVDMIEDIPIINIRYVPLDDAFNKTVKRIEDLTVAIIAIIITSPIMFITAIAVSAAVTTRNNSEVVFRSPKQVKNKTSLEMPAEIQGTRTR